MRAPTRVRGAAAFVPSVLACLLLALTAGGCAYKFWDPYSGWQVVRTKHVTLYTQTRFAHANMLDELELTYGALSSSLLKRRIAPVEVLFLEWPQFRAMFGHYRQGAAIARVPGAGVLGRRGMLVVSEDTPDHVIRHQMAHLFIHAMAPRAPLWLHEGYATWLETAEHWAHGENAGRAACVGRLGPQLPTVPLRELFDWSWQQYDDSKKAEWYKFTAASLVDYFMLGEGITLRDRFGVLIHDIVSGQPSKEALAKTFPELSLATLEQKAIEHRRQAEMRPRTNCPMPFMVAPEDVADRSGGRVAALDKADLEELVQRLWLLPRRDGYVDWFPPYAVSLEVAATKGEPR